MDILKIILNLFIKKQIKVVDTLQINGDDVRKLLTPYTTNLWISDGAFKTINTENLKEFLNSDDVSNRRYINEVHDCDNFAYELEGRVSYWCGGAFGIVWGLTTNGGAHAWNFYIDENKTVKYVEPQTDIVFEPTTEKIWIMII